MGEENDIGCVKTLSSATIELDTKYAVRRLHDGSCTGDRGNFEARS